MKTYNNLFDKICTIKNFKKAYENATKGKKYYKEVKRIERHKNKYLRKLLKEVKEGRYKVSEYVIFELWSGNKWRTVYKLPVKDRIVQHAIMIYLEPIFRETFIIDTYSSIKTRGIHLGLSRVKKYIKNHEDNYYLKLDIHKCYPSLDQNILKNKLKCKIKDEKLINLLFKIIDSCDSGVPIGNYTSQYFNNFYFNEFDHWIKEIKGIKGYFRYCDDIIIICKDKEILHKLFKEIQIKIKELNVELKPNYQIYNIDKEGIDFLGYVTYRTHTEVRKRTKKKFIEKCKNIDFNNLTERDINVLGSYWGIFVHADCRNLWLKYTGVKTFKDLDIKVKERDFVKNIIDKPIEVIDSIIYFKKSEKRVRLTINTNKEENILISSSGECLVEAAEQFQKSYFPFETTIKVNDKGYYIFT